MTAQEAFEYLTSINISFARGNGKTRLFDAINKAIEALLKQIPKKPEYDENTGIYTCPNCRNVSAYDVSAFGDYCENCGQAIKKE